MRRILFRGFDIDQNRIAGFGDAIHYGTVCYLKGKTLGFEDIHIVFPRFNVGAQKISEESFNWQETDYLPWNWYPRNKPIDIQEWDAIIDTTSPNSLYDGFLGIRAPFWHISQYLGIYYKETGLPPLLGKRENPSEYILFHFRDSSVGGYANNARCTVLGEFEYIVKTIKGMLGKKYQYWKIGNPSSIDDEFDRVIPDMYNKMDDFVRLLSDSSLVVSSHSGPGAVAFLIGDLPIIMISISPSSCSEYTESWRGMLGANRKVERFALWCEDRELRFERDLPIDRGKVLSFLKDQNLCG